MKQIYFFVSLFLSFSFYLNAQVELPVDFESATLTYDFVGFEGADSALEGNPDASGENTSATVLRTTKTEGAQFFAGTLLNLDTVIDLSSNTAISVQTWSPKDAVTVRLAIENQAIGFDSQIVVDVVTTTTSAWETLTFDFAGLINADTDYDRVVIFFDFVVDQPGDGSTYYYDTIQLASMSGGDEVVLPVTFDDPELMYVFQGFEGAASTLIANPDMSGENTSANVIETVKTEGAQFFAGTFLNLDAPIAFSDGMGGISVQTWSPKVDIPVRMRLENADNSAGIELDVNTTVTNAWETLTYDFSDILNENVDYVRVVLFFEFVVDLPGDGSTYYFDTIELAETGGDGGDPVVFPLTFEEDLEYSFSGFEGAASAIIDNPDASGENTSARVMETVKTEGAQFFAGTFINLDEPIDFSEETVINMKSWSPKADIPVKMRLENADNSVGIEVDVNTTVTNTWETLSYDFDGQIADGVDFVRVVVFYEFVVDLPGDGSTYYFDTLAVEGQLSTNDVSAVQISAFPNPTRASWNITTASQINSVHVYDVLGKKVITLRPNGTEAVIDAQNLRTGMYIAQIVTAEGVQSLKLLKQ